MGVIADFATVNNSGAVDWNLSLPRRLFDSEFSMFPTLSKLLWGIILTQEQDSLVWRDDDNTFTVKSYYWRIMDLIVLVFDLGRVLRNWKKVWLLICFVWVLARGRMLTTEQLKHRGFSLASECPFCQSAEEDMEHLFYRCSFATIIWDFFL